MVAIAENLKNNRRWLPGQLTALVQYKLNAGEKTGQIVEEFKLTPDQTYYLRQRGIELVRLRKNTDDTSCAEWTLKNSKDPDELDKTLASLTSWQLRKLSQGENPALLSLTRSAQLQGYWCPRSAAKFFYNTLRENGAATAEFKNGRQNKSHFYALAQQLPQLGKIWRANPNLNKYITNPATQIRCILKRPADDAKIQEAIREVPWETYRDLLGASLVMSLNQVAIRAGYKPENLEQIYKIAKKLQEAGIPVGRAPANADPQKDLALFIPRRYISQAISLLAPHNNTDREAYIPSNNGANHKLDTPSPKEQVQTLFESLFEKHQSPIYRYVCRMMNGDVQTALDLTQEAFLRAYQGLPAVLASGEPFRPLPWLYRIATNVCLDELRHRKPIHWQPWETFISRFHPSQVSNEDPERDVLNKEKQEEVQLILNRLQPRHRVCLILREYQDLSYAEIAEALNITVGAVKALLWRAREEFRQVYTRVQQQPVPIA